MRAKRAQRAFFFSGSAMRLMRIFLNEMKL